VEAFWGNPAGLGDALTLLGEDLPNFLSDFAFLFLQHKKLWAVKSMLQDRTEKLFMANGTKYNC